MARELEINDGRPSSDKARWNTRPDLEVDGMRIEACVRQELAMEIFAEAIALGSLPAAAEVSA